MREVTRYPIWSAVLALALSIAGPFAAIADDAPIIADTDAPAHIGQIATVQGLVAEVYTSSKGNVFLDFENPYPNEVFSGVIFSSAVPQFGDLNAYQGKRVQVTGPIRLYKGKPEIILDSPIQLRLAQ